MFGTDGCLSGFARPSGNQRLQSRQELGASRLGLAPSASFAIAAPSASSAVAATDAVTPAMVFNDSEEELEELPVQDDIWRNEDDDHPLNTSHEVGNFGIYFGNWGVEANEPSQRSAKEKA